MFVKMKERVCVCMHALVFLRGRARRLSTVRSGGYGKEMIISGLGSLSRGNKKKSKVDKN